MADGTPIETGIDTDGRSGARGGERLYISLRDSLCGRIYRGEWKDGENLPPERVLAETLGLSRVTVRRALQLLEEDGVLVRVQGSGTRVRLGSAGNPGSLDLIALIAPARKPFFADFLDRFQQCAEARDSLVLYLQAPPASSLEDGLFRLLSRGIRNAVVWADDRGLDPEKTRRLRGLGMNMVYFDTAPQTEAADCVLLDNRAALAALRDSLRRRGRKRIAYLSWGGPAPDSIAEREKAFIEAEGPGAIVRRIPWKDAARVDALAAALVGADDTDADAWLCAEGALGIALGRALRAAGSDLPAASVDDFPGSPDLGLSSYAQDMGALAERSFECLVEQNEESETWKARVHRIPGELIEREKRP